jgi:alpha-glucosidase
LMFALPGSVYLYQGEELGLPEVHDLAVAVLEDPVWERSGRTDKGRDGCRVPIPWRRSGPSFGFGDNGSWLPQPEGWGELSIESQDGVEESTLELYRSAIRIRDERLRGSEDLQWVEHDPGVLALRRPGKFLCLVNYSNSPVALPDGKVLLSSGPLDEGLLGSDTAAWLVEV